MMLLRKGSTIFGLYPNMIVGISIILTLMLHTKTTTTTSAYTITSLPAITKSSSPSSLLILHATTRTGTKVKTSKVYQTTATALVPLVPEPLGGIELQPLINDSSNNTIGISRLKQLDNTVETQKDGENIYTFWMTTYSNSQLISDIRQQILKDASKKANFPGFRKGQVPPYAQPQITQFAIQESIIKTVESMIQSYGLKSISGSNGQVEIHEDVSEMTKVYKMGTSIQFTATLKAQYIDSYQQQQQQKQEQVELETSATTETNTETTVIDAIVSNDNDDIDIIDESAEMTNNVDVIEAVEASGDDNAMGDTSSMEE